MEFSKIPEVLTTSESWSLTLFTFLIQVIKINQLPGTYFIRCGTLFGLGLRYSRLNPGTVSLNHYPKNVTEVLREKTYFNNFTALIGLPLSILFLIGYFVGEYNNLNALVRFSFDSKVRKVLQDTFKE